MPGRGAGLRLRDPDVGRAVASLVFLGMVVDLGCRSVEVGWGNPHCV
ncbi:hypothetical protein LV457_10670 [Mycobacterium sp. MYCO198283]|nr:hypothetical protein [Mycobacterium sp. MYCO198283]MCG5432750.1 hypothetical protein [Mycobacterium sp. MYCO198283]